MIGIVEFIFHPKLAHPKKELEIHEGRKRIDIVMENGAHTGIFYIKEAGAKGLLPLSPAPQIPADPASASLRTISLDDSEHLLHNHHASVASLRLLFTFAPECRSASLRNR